jgi:TRAP-type C4-dicarboxylate transport system permease small subunit
MNVFAATVLGFLLIILGILFVLICLLCLLLIVAYTWQFVRGLWDCLNECTGWPKTSAIGAVVIPILMVWASYVVGQHFVVWADLPWRLF